MAQQILTGNTLSDGVTYHASDINAAVNNATLLSGAVTTQPNVTPTDALRLLASDGSSLFTCTVHGLRSAANTNISSTGVANFRDGIALSGVINVSIAGTQNDYSPVGLEGCTCVQITATTPVTLTGLVAPSVTGTIKVISCVSGTITFNANDTGSAAANRFVLGHSVAASTISSSSTATFMYFGAKWHMIAVN